MQVKEGRLRNGGQHSRQILGGDNSLELLVTPPPQTSRWWKRGACTTRRRGGCRYGGRDLTEHLARLLHLGGTGGAALLRGEREALELAKTGCMRVLDSKDELPAAAAQVHVIYTLLQ